MTRLHVGYLPWLANQYKEPYVRDVHMGFFGVVGVLFVILFQATKDAKA